MPYVYSPLFLLLRNPDETKSTIQAKAVMRFMVFNFGGDYL